MEKLQDVLRDELDLQLSPPTPDPPDVGHNSNPSQVGTPENTQPTPPSQHTLFGILLHLQDNFVKSQDESQANIKTPSEQNKTSKAKKRTA